MLFSQIIDGFYTLLHKLRYKGVLFMTLKLQISDNRNTFFCIRALRRLVQPLFQSNTSPVTFPCIHCHSWTGERYISCYANIHHTSIVIIDGIYHLKAGSKRTWKSKAMVNFYNNSSAKGGENPVSCPQIFNIISKPTVFRLSTFSVIGCVFCFVICPSIFSCFLKYVLICTD